MCCQRRCPICDGETELGRFGHHPDPAVDFCEEVQTLKGLAVDIGIGLGDWISDWLELDQRIFRAMQFRVGGDERAVQAKTDLRELEKQVA